MADLLNIGKSGLNSSKKSLQTTGHNIANANTEGYSRQRVKQTSNIPVHRAGVIQGTGSRVVSINRIHDEHVEKQLDSAVSKNEYFNNRADSLKQIEDIFSELDNDGLNKVLNRFYNSFRELANQPESEVIRSVVKDSAEVVTKDFRRISESLDNIANTTDQKIIMEIENVNQIIKQVANLNKKVADLEVIGGETGDIRDQRDLAIKNLSKSFKVATYVDEKGHFTVSAENVGTLVSAGEAQLLDTNAGKKSETGSPLDGSIDIFYKNRPARPITSKFEGGVVKALIQVRNKDLNELKTNVDSIAYNFVKTVNAVHAKGFVHRQIEFSPSGEPVAFDQKGATSGINFFKDITKENAAAQIDLSSQVKEDLTNIATGIEPNSPGDNRIALAISKIQHEKFMGEGSATIEEEYLQSIGKIGLEASKANFDAEQSEGVLAQVNSIKERISGVSLDEETANMVRFQHAYEASAKVMQTANEMFSTILSLKR